jgi:hypothetical protein
LCLEECARHRGRASEKDSSRRSDAAGRVVALAYLSSDAASDAAWLDSGGRLEIVDRALLTRVALRMVGLK